MDAVLTRRRRKGTVLILVAWTTVALSLVAGTLAFSCRVETVLASQYRERAKSYYVARGGIDAAIGAIASHFDCEAHHAGLEWWSAERRYRDVPLGGGAFTLPASEEQEAQERFGLNDEESKVNVNIATEEMLAAIPSLDNRLAAAIIAQRVRLNSAAGRKDPSQVEPKNEAKAPVAAEEKAKSPMERPPLVEPFRDLDALLAVPGITEEMMRGTPKTPGLSRFLTTRSTGVINVNTAPREVLVALGLEKSVADRIVRGRSGASGIFRDRAGFLAAAKPPKALPRPVQEMIAFHSCSFRVTSVGRHPNAPATVVCAQLSVFRGTVVVTDWRVWEGPPVETAKESGQ